MVEYIALYEAPEPTILDQLVLSDDWIFGKQFESWVEDTAILARLLFKNWRWN